MTMTRLREILRALVGRQHGLMGIPGLEIGTWADVSGSRALDTSYRNTSGRKRRVSIYMSYANADTRASLLVGAADPPTVVVQHGGQAAASGATLYMPFFTEVPSNHYYRVATATGTPAIVAWSEMDE